MKKNKFDLPSEIEKIIKKFNLNENWNKDITQDIELFKSGKFNKKSYKRVNLKELDFVTIDGEDAKDFDDAVYCEKSENNWKLFVAIADVAHYVEENSNIDKEAKKRGTSVYFPNYVIPMLPEILSNNACSLRPNEEKYTFSAVFEINNKTEIVNQWFGRTVTYSDARFAYEEAQQVIETGKTFIPEDISLLLGP